MHFKTTQGGKKRIKERRGTAKTQLMPPGALELCGSALWCSETTVLLIHCAASGWSYWLRHIRGLEGFWQVDKCFLTWQSTGQAVRCSPDRIDCSSLCDTERLWTTHTQTHREPWIYPLIPKPWKGAALGRLWVQLWFTLARYFSTRYIRSPAGSAQGQMEKLIMASIRADTV